MDCVDVMLDLEMLKDVVLDHRLPVSALMSEQAMTGGMVSEQLLALIFAHCVSECRRQVEERLLTRMVHRRQEVLWLRQEWPLIHLCTLLVMKVLTLDKPPPTVDTASHQLM